MRLENWDSVKVKVLSTLLIEKINQHKEVRDALINTGDEEIVEVSPIDDFWGNGADGKGQNQMGKLLMSIRDQIKQEINKP